jgi:hypothetical protein
MGVRKTKDNHNSDLIENPIFGIRLGEVFDPALRWLHLPFGYKISQPPVQDQFPVFELITPQEDIDKFIIETYENKILTILINLKKSGGVDFSAVADTIKKKHNILERRGIENISETYLINIEGKIVSVMIIDNDALKNIKDLRNKDAPPSNMMRLSVPEGDLPMRTPENVDSYVQAGKKNSSQKISGYERQQQFYVVGRLRVQLNGAQEYYKSLKDTPIEQFNEYQLSLEEGLSKIDVVSKSSSLGITLMYEHEELKNKKVEAEAEAKESQIIQEKEEKERAKKKLDQNL